MKRTDALDQVPLFAGLRPKTRRRLAREAALTYRYEPGAELIRQGEEGETLFVLLDGRAKVVKNGRTVRRVGPGDFVGEISVLNDRPRSASVVAEDEVRSLVLHREALEKLLAKEPKAAWAMLGTLAARISGD
jgi:CRP-like cAMP-binding protein